MKRIIFIVQLVIVIFIHNCVQSQNHTSDAYDFPIKPGMDEWKEFTNYNQRIEALEIPDSIITSISTEGLIVTCLNYPGLINALAYNNVLSGFETVVNSFNGFQELLKREDLGSNLIEYYQKMYPDKFDETYKNREEYEGVFQYFGIEMLLSQYTILDSISYTDKVRLVKVTIEKYKAKQDNPQNFGNITKVSACLIVARTMSKLNIPKFDHEVQNNEKLKSFILSGRIHNAPDFDLLISKCEMLISTVEE